MLQLAASNGSRVCAAQVRSWEWPARFSMVAECDAQAAGQGCSGFACGGGAQHDDARPGGPIPTIDAQIGCMTIQQTYTGDRAPERPPAGSCNGQ